MRHNVADHQVRPMRLPRVPTFLVDALAPFPERFLAAAHMRSISHNLAQQLLGIVPEEIADSVCFHDRLTDQWRYDFGAPFDEMPDGYVVLGTHMFHPIDRLVHVLACARQRIPEVKFAEYVTRLANPSKHGDVLAELIPVIRLGPEIEVEFEIVGYGIGNRTIDWLIRASTGPLILLDVKNRSRDLIESFQRIAGGERAPDGTVPAPAHDAALLFRSLESKFPVRNPAEVLQGAWIRTGLKQEESELRTSFARLDHSRVHFAILGDWADDAHILQAEGVGAGHLIGVFGLQLSERFIFHCTANA